MMYYVDVHTGDALNNLQKKLGEAAEEWQGALVNGDEAREKCVENFKFLCNRYNEEFPKCKPCQLALFGRGFMLYAEDKKRDHTFAVVFFNKVQSHYDGITHWRI